MAASTAITAMDDDPLITILLGGEGDEEEDRWEIRKSKLIKHSGFFRRMFRNDCIETRQNKVIIHDTEVWEVGHLMTWLAQGKVVDMDEDGVCLGSYDDAEHFHFDALAVYELLDKYDCPDFTPGCLRLIARYAKSCCLVSDWDDCWEANDFMKHHYEILKRIDHGHYPAKLRSFFAEVWWFFSSKDAATAKLDAALEEDHELAVAVAKSCRTRFLATKKSMEAFEGSEFD